MANVAFIPASATGSLDLHLDGTRTGTLDPTRLAAILATPEPAHQKYPDTWLVQTGRDLFQLLQLTPTSLDQDRLLELDFTRLDPSSVLHTLPWELLHDGTLFLAQQAIPIIRIVRHTERKPFPPANRALSLLFQACSPENTGAPLDFEKEESEILTAAQVASIDLLTEETGTLDGLDLIAQTRAGEIDAYHLTGHADLFDPHSAHQYWLPPNSAPLAKDTPVFLMENDLGHCELATATALCDLGFRNTWPKLVFVSGCSTGGQANATTPSMARALITKGAPAVLAWRRPVRDVTGHPRRQGNLRQPRHRLCPRKGPRPCAQIPHPTRR